MSDDKTYDDPTNRIVCVFDDRESARKAKEALLDLGYTERQVRSLRGEKDAGQIDISAKWFADTDKEIKNFVRELRAGNTVLSAPVQDQDRREQIHKIMKLHDARHITHFGDWITEVMK